MIKKKKKKELLTKLTRRGTLHLIKDIYDKTIANITLNVPEVLVSTVRQEIKGL